MLEAKAARLSLLCLSAATCTVCPLRADPPRWQPFGPEAGRVLALDVDPRSPGTLYAGTPAGVFKSADGAATRPLSRSGLPTGAVAVVKVDPRSPATVLASVGSRIFRSADGAATWAAASQGLPPAAYPGVTALAFDAQVPSTLYAADAPYVWRSTDGGDSWSLPGTQFVGALALAVDPIQPQI